MSTRGKAHTHVLVIPYPAPGHMLPHFNLAHHLALRGIVVTILVFPKNLPLLTNLLSVHPSMQTLVIPFPTHPSIPDGVENMQDLPITFLPHIISSSKQLYNPVLVWFKSHPSPPKVIISNVLFSSWTFSLAQELGIKRIGFAPMHAATMCSWWSEVERKDELELPGWIMEGHLANLASWGIIINSFGELDKVSFAQLKDRFMKHDRVWGVGPLLPIKFEHEPKPTPPHEAIKWLDSCPVDGSVVYVTFGSHITLTRRQMEALATSLDTSGVRFIWSVKEPMKDVQVEGGQNMVPAGFEERVAGRGLLVKGWAPQAAILNHPAVGAYLTHSGWNSALEGLCAGVLLLAWPMQADQFNNTKLLVDEWGAAIKVCEGLETVPDSVKLARVLTESVNAIRPEKIRAMELKNLALQAIKEGGSSFKALDGLVEELSALNSN